MNLTTRTIIAVLAVLSAAAITATSLLRLTVTAVADWYAELPSGLLDRVVGDDTAALIALVTGVLGIVVSVLLLARTRGAPARPGVGVAAVVVTLAALLLAPGNLIPVAGYLFALTAVGIVIAGTVLLVLRRPLIGAVVVLALAGVAVLVTISLDGTPLPLQLVVALAEQLPRLAATAAYVVLAATIVLSAIGDAGGHRDALARWVLAHRTAITLVAALCAVPYTLVRATWLTPWPLFGGSREMFAADPAIFITGLMLGFGMLMGGVLTLGLVRPWGERFPRWFAGLGGRQVPVGLPVISAMTVAVLFVGGGADFVVQVFEGAFSFVGAEAVVEFFVVFPFWLWGPTLGLAVWGYAMHRADQREAADAAAPVLVG